MSTAPETTIPANEHETTRQRVLAVAGWLVEGKLRPECVAAAMTEWQVSRRTAQEYVARAARRIANATTFQDPLFVLKLSQVQRDRLHQELQELLRTGDAMPPPVWQIKLKTIQADMKLLDSRDRTAAKLLELAAKHGRPEPRRPRVKATVGTKVEEKTLRPEPPAAKTNPALAPKPPLPLVECVKRAQAAFLPGAEQLTAQIAIVPPQRKGLDRNEMRPRQQPAAAPAPGADSCAFHTGGVDNPALQ